MTFKKGDIVKIIESPSISFYDHHKKKAIVLSGPNYYNRYRVLICGKIYAYHKSSLGRI